MSKALRPMINGVRRGPKKSIIFRLMSRVIKKRNGCWVWQGASAAGYGVIWNAGGCHGVHRVSYEIHVGPIPRGLVIDHLCRVPLCVNPDHMEIVTYKINTARGGLLLAIKSRSANKTSCIHGHEYTDKSTIVHPQTGWRSCRLCSNARQRERRQEKKDNAGSATNSHR